MILRITPISFQTQYPDLSNCLHFFGVCVLQAKEGYEEKGFNCEVQGSVL
jgi:hypothetical protein